MKQVQTYPAQMRDQEIYPPAERLRPPNDLIKYLQQYARERPAVVAAWCLGIGFVLGWKLKPW